MIHEPESSDVIVERDVDFNEIGNKFLDLLELLDVVLGQYVVAVGDLQFSSRVSECFKLVSVAPKAYHHPCHKSTKRRDSVPLSNAQYRRINMGSSSLKCTVRVGDSTSTVIVEMRLNIATHDSTKCANKVLKVQSN